MGTKITLKAARVNAGLSQKEAAMKLGVDRSTLYLWENGKSSPSVVMFKKIEDIYGIPYDEINFLPYNTRNAY